MRKPRGPTTKTFGYLVVPVFAGIDEKDSLKDAIKSEKFEVVVDVLNALQEHDEELVDIVREIRERKGAGEPFVPRRLNEKVEVIGPRVDLDRLTTSIEVAIAERIGSSWYEWFGLLTRFKAREGHCRVPLFIVKELLSSAGGSAHSDQIEIACPLHAGSGWTRSDLFGIRLGMIGKEDLPRSRPSKHARVTVSSLRIISKSASSLGSGWVSSAPIKIQCPLNADSDWMQTDLFGVRLKVDGKKVLQR